MWVGRHRYRWTGQLCPASVFRSTLAKLPPLRWRRGGDSVSFPSDQSAILQCAITGSLPPLTA
eukprot:3229147-Rhodomonas_salina.1